jgi:acetyl-CoA C-acetyltransferase
VTSAFIVDAVRTAGGRRKGRLSGIHATDLGAISLNALINRSGIDPAVVEDVIMGCVTQAGEQSNHVGRNCVLASDLPESVPAVTIDRQCGSSQQAIHFAAQAVMSGTQDVVIAAGVESMTRAPMGSATLLDQGKDPLSDAIKQRFGVKYFTQFQGAEMMAQKHGFSREEMDEFAYQSHLKAVAARGTSAFENELVAVDVTLEDGTSVCHDADEGIRDDASTAALVGHGGIVSDTGRVEKDGNSQALNHPKTAALKP